MSYITIADLKARLGAPLYARLTDRTDGVSENDTTGQQIVDEAEALLDARLAARYATPVDLGAHPELAGTLRNRALDVAEFLAWRSSPFTTAVPDRVLALREETEAWLVALARGELELPSRAPPASRTATDDAARFHATERKFTAEELDGL